MKYPRLKQLFLACWLEMTCKKEIPFNISNFCVGPETQKNTDEMLLKEMSQEFLPKGNSCCSVIF